MLAAGARAAVTRQREPASGAACAGGAGLQWHGPWLLYSDSGGDLALIDAAGRHPAIQLGALVRRLFAHRAGLDAYWSR